MATKNEEELRTVGLGIRGYQPTGGEIYQIPTGREMITRR
jgi:hypothetical protein